jgi:hypothetical protein
MQYSLRGRPEKYLIYWRREGACGGKNARKILVLLPRRPPVENISLRPGQGVGLILQYIKGAKGRVLEASQLLKGQSRKF